MFATARTTRTAAPVRPLAFAHVPGRWGRGPIDTLRSLQGGACSHVGLRREANEDAWLARPDVGLFVVCDGVGGHAAGDVASRMAVEALGALADQAPKPTAIARELRSTLEQSNSTIFADGEANHERTGMATTAAALWLDGGRAILAHVGDSRIYRLRDGHLEQLTLDHSLVGDAVRLGLLTPEQAAKKGPCSIITRCMGSRDMIEVELGATAVRPGDRFILCSDGLSDMIPEAQLKRIARDQGIASEATRQLVLAALDAGGYDNVTVLVVDVG